MGRIISRCDVWICDVQGVRLVLTGEQRSEIMVAVNDLLILIDKMQNLDPLVEVAEVVSVVSDKEGPHAFDDFIFCCRRIFSNNEGYAENESFSVSPRMIHEHWKVIKRS